MAEQKDVIYFIAQVGHEIRTPLNAIKGFGQLLDDETFGSLNEQQHKYLDKMLESSDRLLEIVEQLLDWAKLESGQAILQYESVDLYYLKFAIYWLLKYPKKISFCLLLFNVKLLSLLIVRVYGRFCSIF